MAEIIFQTHRLYKIAGRRQHRIIILLRKAWLKIFHVSVQAPAQRRAEAFRCSHQFKDTSIRDERSAGILCFSVSVFHSLKELCVSEIFLAET